MATLKAKKHPRKSLGKDIFPILRLPFIRIFQVRILGRLGLCGSRGSPFVETVRLVGTGWQPASWEFEFMPVED